MHHVQIQLQQFLIIGKDLRAGHAVFLGGLLSALFDDVAERDHFNVLQLLQGGHVLAVGDAAAADNTNFDHIHRCFPPPVKSVYKYFTIS